ncbi:Bardet-Biedl syndrome 1 protein [Clonorchis sinensis]|uniref:Bardet-Biedl syndrome 1 protein n=1 Tax=Clonorchis sinensis TaxID=79923 RepID=A0A8T1MX05_CLOSI|nr:Bardet-Biedl syndrome 1 protein [Clonorchis sinensis]
MTSQKSKLQFSEKWLLATSELKACTSTFSQSMCFGDPLGTGVNALCLTDFGISPNKSKSEDVLKLKIYSGTELKQEIRLIDPPCGMCTFSVRIGDSTIQDLAVAAGPHIYIYRKLKPYFRITLPPLEVDTQEEESWKKAGEGELTPKQLQETLQNLHTERRLLTARSLRFIQLPPTEACEFLEAYRSVPLKRETVATCMAKMYRHQSSPDAAECIIVGIEDSALYIFDPVTYSVLTKIALPAIPVHLCATGSFDVDYRIVVSCRNATIYQARRTTTTITAGIDVGSQIIGLVRSEKSIVTACMDQTIKAFSLSGRLLWSIRQPSPILVITSMILPSHSFDGYVVSLTDGTVRLYRDRQLCDVILTWTQVTSGEMNRANPREDVEKTDLEAQMSADSSEAKSIRPKWKNLHWLESKVDPIVACCFGSFERELGSLALVTQNGAMLILLVKRSAKFSPSDMTNGSPSPVVPRLQIPKRSKAFMELAAREKQNAPEIHRKFVRDLTFLKHTVAKTFLELLETRAGPMAMPGAKQKLRLNSQIFGLGPTFVLSMEIVRTLSEEDVGFPKFKIVLHFDETVYQIRPSMLVLPLLVPNMTYKFVSSIKALKDTRISDKIKIHVLSSDSCSGPLFTTFVNVPPFEPA